MPRNRSHIIQEWHNFYFICNHTTFQNRKLEWTKFGWLSRIDVALYRNRPYSYSYSLLVIVVILSMDIGGSKGGRQGRAPPRGPNSFIFMQFLAKNWKIIALLGVGAPPGENPGSATDGGGWEPSYLAFLPKTAWNLKQSDTGRPFWIRQC